MNISHSMNELTRIDEIEWSKTVLTGVLVLDNWVKLWEAHLCFDACCRLYWLLLVFEGDLYVDLSFISEWEAFLGRILIWIIDLGTLLVLDRCRECEITGDSFRMALCWMRLMKLSSGIYVLPALARVDDWSFNIWISFQILFELDYMRRQNIFFMVSF